MADIGAFISGCAGLSLTPDEISFFAARNPWGLILFKRNCESVSQVQALTASFRAAVGRRNAPVLIDQEGGRVQRMGPPVWRKYPAARAYGDLYARDPLAALRSARNVGRLMAEELFEAGITVDCVPVLDVPGEGMTEAIGSRAYGPTLEVIMALARAHAAGFLQGGVLPVIKHVPGHGRATVDSHLSLPVVNAAAKDLRAADFAAFAAFADAPMGMTAHLVYTALDKENPATLSAKIIKRIIRGEIGFNGLLMTDDLSMKALGGSFTEKVERALSAGCDVALHCSGVLAEMEEVAKAAGPLKGKALRRAKAALKAAQKPQPFDRKAAMKDLASLVSA